MSVIRRVTLREGQPVTVPASQGTLAIRILSPACSPEIEIALASRERLEPLRGAASRDAARLVVPGELYQVAGPARVGGVQFKGDAGRTYAIDTSRLRGAADPFLGLYDASSNRIAEDDDGGEEPQAARIEWLCLNTGSYFVSVEDRNTGGDGSFDFVIREGPVFEIAPPVTGGPR